jgi:hypothetical protein
MLQAKFSIEEMQARFLNNFKVKKKRESKPMLKFILHQRMVCQKNR